MPVTPNRYQPTAPPSGDDLTELVTWVLREFETLSIVLNNAAAGEADICYAPPDKPRTGMIRYADGAQWNPGSGAGFYGFRNGTWGFLG
jgi:hypothetical protein